MTLHLYMYTISHSPRVKSAATQGEICSSLVEIGVIVLGNLSLINHLTEELNIFLLIFTLPRCELIVLLIRKTKITDQLVTEIQILSHICCALSLLNSY